MKFAAFFSILLWVYNISFGQCILSNRLDTACSFNSITIPATGQEQSVIWDFKPGDLTTDPVGTSLGTFSEAIQSQKITLVYDSVSWHGFLPGKTKMYHFLFNDSLTRITQTNILDVYGGFASRPSAIEFIYQGGNWYGFGVFINGNRIIRFDFGSDLSNTPTPVNYGTLGGLNVPQGMDVIENGNEYMLAITNQNTKKITMINLGPDVSVIPDPSLSVFDLPGAAVSYQDIKFIKVCQNWYALAVAFNQNVYRYSFGNSLLNAPSVEDLTPVLNPTFPGPTGIEITFDKGKFLGLISTNRAQIYVLDFGNSIANPPTNYKITNVPPGMAQSYGIELSKSQSLTRAFFLNSVSQELFVCAFDNINNGANTNESVAISPTNLMYSSSGWKYLQAEVTQTDGQKKYRYDSVYISSSPNLNFVINKSCNYDTTTFEDQSLSSSGIKSWLWKFSSTDSSVSQNTTFHFPLSGSNSIFHRVTDNHGCSADTTFALYISDSLDIQPDFNWTGAACTNSPIQFVSSSSYIKDTIKGWSWDFDGLGTSVSENPTFTFTDKKTYTINYIAFGKSGCSQSTAKSLTLSEGPAVFFDFSGTCQDDVFSFANATSGAGITGYEWDFGDGYFSTQTNPTHNYIAAGNYVASLTAANDQGCRTQLDQVVPVRYLPQANFTNDLACSDNDVTFFDQSTVTDANITNNQWTLSQSSFGYDTTAIGSSPVFKVTKPGTYQVRLITTSNYGCADTLYRDINVYESPKADFSIDNTCYGDSATFSQQVNLPEGTTLLSADWLIDGTSLSGNDVKYKVSQPGTYPVELFVRASNLCPGNASKSMKIAPLPTLDIQLSDQCEDQKVLISEVADSPDDPVLSYSWSINQKPVSLNDQFYYEFKKADDYQVSLLVNTENNCQKSMEQTVTIHPAPRAAFDVFPSFGANPLEVQFTDRSTDGQVIKYYFSNYNSDSSTAANPEYTYLQTGEDLARQVVENEFGCRDTASHEISVVEPVYDLGITQVTMEATGNVLTFEIGLVNNGTIIINNPAIRMDIAQSTSLTHTLQTSLMPGASGTYKIDVDLLKTAGNPINYVCFSSPVNLGKYEDIRPYDNAQCVSIDQLYNLLNPYPNPSKDYVMVPVILPRAGMCTLQMTDEGGRMVYQKTFSGMGTGLNEIEIDLAPYRSGIYMVTIKTEDFSGTKKIVIQ